MSHERQRSLLDQLVDTSGDSAIRAAVLADLKQELERHAAAEERFFYVPLMQHDRTHEQSRHSIGEHEEIDEFLARLEATDRSSPGWLTIARQMKERVEHHLEEEEQEVFPQAGKALSDAQKTELAEGYRALMDELGS